MGEFAPDPPGNSNPALPERTIEAETVLRVFLEPTLAESADPRGLSIEGTLISGNLDMDYFTIEYPLQLVGLKSD